MPKKKPSIMEAVEYLGVSWKNSRLPPGMKFCGCKNPKHGDGCSIPIITDTYQCMWCSNGCEACRRI